MTESPDPYSILGVARDAEPALILAAYRALARKHHPDLAGASGEAMMRKLNAAWEILRDQYRRAAYDRSHPVHSFIADPIPPFSTYPVSGSSGSSWYGEAGKPPGRPSGSILTFGRYRGWSLGEIARTDPNWLDWLRYHPSGRQYVTEIETLRQPATASRSVRPAEKPKRKHFWS